MVAFAHTHLHEALELGVADLAATRRFYEELFGFEAARDDAGETRGTPSVLLRSPLPGFEPARVRLSTGPVRHDVCEVRVAMEAAEDLLDLYLLALLMGVPTRGVQRKGGRLTACLVDPDGRQVWLEAAEAGRGDWGRGVRLRQEQHALRRAETGRAVRAGDRERRHAGRASEHARWASA